MFARTDRRPSPVQCSVSESREDSAILVWGRFPGMQPRKTRCAIAAATLCTTGITLASPLTSSAYGATSDPPVIATGVVPSRFTAADLQVELLPAINGGMTRGTSLPTYFVPKSGIHLSSDHRLVVRLAPESVPRAFRWKDGVVNVVIHAGDSTGSWDTSLSAQSVTTSAVKWADPQQARDVIFRYPHPSVHATYSRATARISGSGSLTTTLADLPAPRFGQAIDTPVAARVTANVVSPRCPDGGSGPHQSQFLSEKRAWATIGTSYPVGQDSAFMAVSTSSSNGAKYGGALAYSGVKAFASGSAFASGDWGFTWNSSGNSRSYRKQVDYIRYREYNYLGGPGCDHVRWIADKETGGTATNTEGVTRPNWTQCVPQSPGLWTRGTSTGYKYEYGAAVKLEEALGIDLSISRSYSSTQKLAYHIHKGNKRLCGNDSTPATAGKIMEKFR